MTLHFLNDVANDAESTNKIDNYVIIASLKGEKMGKLINRILGSRLLIRMSNRSASLAIQQALSKPCLVNLISNDTHLVFSIYRLYRLEKGVVPETSFGGLQRRLWAYR